MGFRFEVDVESRFCVGDSDGRSHASVSEPRDEVVELGQKGSYLQGQIFV